MSTKLDIYVFIKKYQKYIVYSNYPVTKKKRKKKEEDTFNLINRRIPFQVSYRNMDTELLLSFFTSIKSISYEIIFPKCKDIYFYRADLSFL
jgi:hypothetical protein